MKREVIIVGSGVAGMSCAIYLGLAGVKTTIIGDWAGSSLAMSPMVKNYPGAGHVDGATILQKMSSQMMISKSVTNIQEQCLSIAFGASGFLEIKLETGEIMEADVLVVATGSTPKTLGIPGEEDLIGSGISTCAYCDGDLCEGKRVAVVGGGNVAIDEAIYLSSIVDHVDLIVRKSKLREDFRMSELQEIKNISILLGTELKEIRKLEDGSMLTVDENGEERAYGCVFYAIGSTPNVGMIDKSSLGSIFHDDHGAVWKNYFCGNRIYSIGDVSKTHEKKQAILAAADGARAAIDIIG